VSVALVTQHVKCMRGITLLSVTCLAVPLFFQRYLVNSTVFEKKKLSIKCEFLTLSTITTTTTTTTATTSSSSLQRLGLWPVLISQCPSLFWTPHFSSILGLYSKEKFGIRDSPICVLQILSKTFLVLKNQRCIVINVHGSS
jgi:hypothetical protein